MALTFIGLLYVQITYMGNMVRMRNDQFSEGVKRALYAVSNSLEQEETKHFLEQDVAQIESWVVPSVKNSDNKGGVGYSFTTTGGVEGNLTLKGDLSTLSPQLTHEIGRSNKSLQEILRGQYLYQSGLLNEVILNILSHSSNRPIEERADSAMVNGLLQSELANNGINLPFEFAVVNRIGAVVYETSGYSQAAANSGSLFVQTLFPNDAKNRMNYIRLYFPDKKEYIFQSIKFMLPSFVFTLILLVVFLYTIILAFRQKKLTEMKNDFINNMTHEFKTPISTISLAAQMLNDGSVRKSPKMLEHISSVINDETKRLRFQVEKVLQMSMYDNAGGSALKFTVVNVNNIIYNVVNTQKIKAEKDGGRIDMDLDAINADVRLDEMHFTNVIFNLLDNALKYMKEDTAPELKVSTHDVAHGQLEIRIRDNGIGIKKENLKRIFDKFYRVSTGNLHDVKGFGLGLAYVKKMVQIFGGNITAESEYGKWSEFVIRLPLVEEDADDSVQP